MYINAKATQRATFECWIEHLAAMDRQRLAEWNLPKFDPLRQWVPVLPSDITAAHISQETLPTDAERALLAEWFIPAITAYEADARKAATMVCDEVVEKLTVFHTELRRLFEEFNRGGKSWGWLNGGRLVARKALDETTTVH